MGVFTEEVGVGSVAAAIVLVAWGVSQQNTQRSCLCCTSRSQPTTRILWHHHPIPAQSWRGSQAQSGTQRDCHAPDGTPPRHALLCRQAPGARKDISADSTI